MSGYDVNRMCSAATTESLSLWFHSISHNHNQSRQIMHNIIMSISDQNKSEGYQPRERLRGRGGRREMNQSLHWGGYRNSRFFHIQWLARPLQHLWKVVGWAQHRGKCTGMVWAQSIRVKFLLLPYLCQGFGDIMESFSASVSWRGTESHRVEWSCSVTSDSLRPHGL